MNDYKNINAQKCKDIADALKMLLLSHESYQGNKYTMAIREAIDILENINEYHITHEISVSDTDFYMLPPEDRFSLIKKQLAIGISKHIVDNMEIEQRMGISTAHMYVGHFICIDNRNQGIKRSDDPKRS